MKKKENCRDVFPDLFPKKFKLQAHRGISEKFPENTLVSFEAAGMNDKFWGIETDVQQTSDGVLVVFHDLELDDKTTGTGRICDYSFRALSHEVFYDNNVKGLSKYPQQRIPCFEDYLDVCIKYSKVPYIELKQLSRHGIFAVLDILVKKGLWNRVVLSTFNRDYVEQLRCYTRDYPLEFMFGAQEDANNVITKLCDYKNVVLRPAVSQITSALVKKCHDAGLLVEGYGLMVGDNATLKKLIAWGVEGASCNSAEGLEL